MEKKYECLLCLGSNTEGMVHLKNAEKTLNRFFPLIRWGKILKTPAEGDTVCETTYLNRIAKFQTSLDMETVQHILKQVEVENGRTAESKRTGISPLDIDLLEFNGQVLKPEDMRKNYVRRAMLLI